MVGPDPSGKGLDGLNPFWMASIKFRLTHGIEETIRMMERMLPEYKEARVIIYEQDLRCRNLDDWEPRSSIQ
jgi:hypothetical protein